MNNDVCSVLEATEFVLLGKTFKSEPEALEYYNQYAYSKGFSIRVDKHKKREKDGSLKMKRFVCSRQGFKDNKCKNNRGYERFDVRCGCLAYVQFHIDVNGLWTCA